MSTRLFPPLPPELVTFAESGVSVLVATRDAALRPDAVRAMGVRVWPGASQLTVYLAAATSAQAIANLRDNGRLALTVSEMTTHVTVQIKGTVREVREAREDEREIVERYRAMFSDELAVVGLPPRISTRLSCWPAFAADLEIAEAFTQTPGPGAGDRLGPA